MVQTRGKREEQPDGLTPKGVKRLRDLRDENTNLRIRLWALEKELEQERNEHRVARLMQEYTPDAPKSQGMVPEKEEAKPSGPGMEARAPPVTPPGGGHRVAQRETKSPHRVAHIAGNLAFYLALVLLLAGAVLLRSARNGAPVSIAGYSGMLVLSESMQDVIPKDSFILTKHVEAESLQVGDDITFMVSSDTSVTHRIVDIHHQANGTIAFQTKGVNNQQPDSDLVMEGNVVGKVIYHNLLLGQIAQWISGNWPLLLFLLGVWAMLGRVLTHTMGSRKEEGGRRLKKRETASIKKRKT